MNKIAVFSCSKNTSKTILEDSIEVINKYIKTPIEIYTKKNNKQGLSKCYNDFLYSKQASNYEYIAFVHDDIMLDDALIESKLERYHRMYDIIGIAGGNNCKIQNPAMWHIMCGGLGSGNLHGAAGHVHNDKSYITAFGLWPMRVTLIDGVFMSVNVEKVKSVNWKFNENYDFHLYDISSCLDANKKRLKIGVVPIHLTHNSPGLRDINDKTFQRNNKQFLQEYSNY